MPRPRTFDPDDALDAAVNVFWRKGFAETSYDDLVSATGVSRKGLYTVFGDKEALFLAALKRYCKVRIPEMFAVLEKPDVSLREVEAMFLWLTDLVASYQLTQGCFMANTAADEMIGNPAVKSAYDSYVDTMKSMFANAFLNAGLDHKTAQRLAIYYLGILQSLQLMAHSRTDSEFVRGFMDVALEEIRKHAV